MRIAVFDWSDDLRVFFTELSDWSDDLRVFFTELSEQYSSLIYEANKLSGLYETSQPSGPPKLDEAEKALLEHKKHERDVARIEAPPPPPKRPRLVDNRTTNNNNRCTINYFFGPK